MLVYAHNQRHGLQAAFRLLNRGMRVKILREAVTVMGICPKSEYLPGGVSFQHRSVQGAAAPG